MGIWILKQDGKGIASPNELNIFSRNSKHRNSVFAIATEKGTDIGLYTSEEKAKKVIKDILHAISEPEYSTLCIGNEYERYSERIYKMPQDSEVDA